jgi:two-component system cell cycle response regulator
MIELDNGMWRGVLDAAPEGIVICAAQGADHPVVYANAAFARLSGFGIDELLGADLRRLQGDDREQEGRARLRQALAQGVATRALLRNYRKDGTQFWNEIFLEPLRAPGGAPTHFVAFHRDVGERERAAGAREGVPLPVLLRQDRLTNLHSRAWFEELLRHDWQVGKREERLLTVMLFGIDALAAYVERFGRQAGDTCIRRLAGVVNACFRRGSDVVARWDDSSLIALVRSTAPGALEGFAQMISQRVLDQCIHHPRAGAGKYVTVSAGVASLLPTAAQAPEALLRAAERALHRAQEGAGGRVMLAGSGDFAGTDPA